MVRMMVVVLSQKEIMTTPISGPFYSTVTAKGPPNVYGYKPNWFTRTQWKYTQKRPFTLPLPYEGRITRVLHYSGPNDTHVEDSSAESVPGQYSANAYNKAYARFVEKIKGDTSALAVGAVEARQTMGSVEKRVLQLYRFSRALKKLDFAEAGRQLGYQSKRYTRNIFEFTREGRRRRMVDPITGKPTGLYKPGKVFKSKKIVFSTRNTAKAFADNWLEFSFGLLPVYKDIRNSIDVLQRPMPSHRIEASATVKAVTKSITSNPANYFIISRDYTARSRIAATVTVSNPNLFRANQLGLINPATTLVELVPFSFVLNWFVNLSEFLESFTDFYGLSILEPYYTTYEKCIKSSSSRITNLPPAQPIGKVTFYSSSYEYVRVVRVRGQPPGPTLGIRPPWRISPWRAANAVSLLTQFLKSAR